MDLSQWTKEHGYVLTWNLAVILGDLIRAVHSGKHVSYMWSGQSRHGVLRSIGDVNGNFVGEHDDVRGAHVRITTDQGWEHFVPIAELVHLTENGLFALDD